MSEIDRTQEWEKTKELLRGLSFVRWHDETSSSSQILTSGPPSSHPTSAQGGVESELVGRTPHA